MTYACNSKGFETNYKLFGPGAKCCISSNFNPNMTYNMKTDSCTGPAIVKTEPVVGSSVSGSVSGSVSANKNKNDTFKNIENFFQQFQGTLPSLPPLNTGLSNHTEKIIFFGLPFVLFIAILLSILVLIGLSIDSLKN